MGSCGDSADGWEGTQEETLRRHGRRRGIICNVATLGWAVLAWWHLTSEAAGHRTGSRQRASAQCCLLLCVSVLCCVYCCALCGSSVLEVGGGRTRWQPRPCRGRRQTRPGPHTANTSRHTPAASCRSCHAPGWWPPRPQLRPGGRAAAGWWVWGGWRSAGLCMRRVYWSGPAAGHHLLLYGYVQCPVLGAVSSVCLSTARHGTMGWCRVQCSVSRAADNWLINTLSIIQQVDKLCFISQLDNFLLLLRDPTWK